VIDEGHYIKTKTAQRTAHVHQLCKGVKAVAVLTGTPATNRPIELWPIVSLLKPKEFSSFKKFADKFCDPQYSPWGWTYNGATNLDVLHRKLKRTCMIRRRTDEVFKDMPPLTRQVITIEPSNEEMKEYREAERDFLGWLARTAPHRSSNARKAERLTRMQQLKMMCGLIKLPHAHRWINDALEETTGKMIMFGHHKAVVRGSYEKYQKQSVIIDGKVSKAKRQESIDQFTRDRRTRLIFGNIAAAGSAWNGQAATRVGFLEIGWTPGELAQCEKRAHRIGQGEPVFVYYLIIPDTIEDKLLKVIQSKQKVLDEIIDGREQEGSFNLYDELERLMLEKRNNSK
jgi:SWI/SNF-related matrix-associated actin-dependent regulator 1 of chromatin subfamily A